MTEFHILNGQFMYDHFEKNEKIKGQLMAPFNEAMCYGKTSEYIFSNEFILTRAKALGVPLEQYKAMTLAPLKPLLEHKFTSVCLWFDADMFCQINLLTILAWLEQMEYQNSVTIHLVDDLFDVIKTDKIEAKGYDALYKKVLIDKTMPLDFKLPTLQRGVELYLNYLKPHSEIITCIKKNRHIPKNELVALLINTFTQYGLGDTQYIELIRKANEAN